MNFLQFICGFLLFNFCACFATCERASPFFVLRLATSFAGFDVEAVNQVRKHLLPYPPSSPAIALFKNGELVSIVERHQIEGRPAQVIAQHLISVFDEYCN